MERHHAELDLQRAKRVVRSRRAPKEKFIHHLQLCDVLLPLALLPLAVHRGEIVVKIHDDVHERVDRAHEHRVSASEVFRANPGERHHSSVVIDVQERDVRLLLLQHEEDGVEEIEDLREEVEMSALGEHHRVVICGWVVDRLAEPVVALTEAVIICGHCDVRANRHLEQIVVLYDAVELEGLAFLHELRSPFQHKVEVHGEQGHRLEGVRDQKLVANPDICEKRGKRWNRTVSWPPSSLTVVHVVELVVNLERIANDESHDEPDQRLQPATIEWIAAKHRSMFHRRFCNLNFQNSNSRHDLAKHFDYRARLCRHHFSRNFLTSGAFTRRGDPDSSSFLSWQVHLSSGVRRQSWRGKTGMSSGRVYTFIASYWSGKSAKFILRCDKPSSQLIRPHSGSLKLRPAVDDDDDRSNRFAQSWKAASLLTSSKGVSSLCQLRPANCIWKYWKIFFPLSCREEQTDNLLHIRVYLGSYYSFPPCYRQTCARRQVDRATQKLTYQPRDPETAIRRRTAERKKRARLEIVFVKVSVCISLPRAICDKKTRALSQNNFCVVFVSHRTGLRRRKVTFDVSQPLDFLPSRRNPVHVCDPNDRLWPDRERTLHAKDKTRPHQTRQEVKRVKVLAKDFSGHFVMWLPWWTWNLRQNNNSKRTERAEEISRLYVALNPSTRSSQQRSACGATVIRRRAIWRPQKRRAHRPHPRPRRPRASRRDSSTTTWAKKRNSKVRDAHCVAWAPINPSPDCRP